MLTLYHGMVSTCSQKARFALAEKGLNFVARQLDFPEHEQLSDWYLALNPNGVVPTLVDDDTIVTDSSVICEYLDEAYPDPPLGPRDPAGRARMRAWMRYLEEVPTVAIRAPSFNAVFGRGAATMSAERFDALTARMPLRKQFYRRMSGGKFSPTEIAESEERLAATLDRAERALADAAFLCGPALTIADIVLLPTVVRMEDLGMSRFWAARPRVAGWYARMQERPAFVATFPPAARVAPGRIGLG